ncbi:IS66 family insertion sequence element accessory protein TnpA [Castellaniella caeni]|uniref:IS66 family insertion sequence element accessory protein TnpA n=1 Tax=Castellaniella caeni TaxID=266123 RepID=UPI00082C4D32|nr:hypothetical protein [Castellaniella caeni]
MTNKNRDWWRAHLQRIETEALTTKAYADREGLEVAALYYWRKVFKAEAGRAAPHTHPLAARFVELQLCDEPGSVPVPQRSPGCRLRLPSGLSLEMAALPDVYWLAQLTRALPAEQR